MSRTHLAVGERERSHAGLATVASLALATVFVLFTWISKETPGLNLHQPWQDDPYDVLVSLDFVIVPVLVVGAAQRVQLCRRHVALPARRLVDLLRLCEVAVAVCLATEMSEWAAVALGIHRATWTAATAWQVVVLALLTLATSGTFFILLRAAHGVRSVAAPSDQPDWLTDAMTLGLCVARCSGRHRFRVQAVVRSIDAHVVTWVRRHPIAAAALLACVLALPYVTAKVVLEGYPPALVVFSFALPAASLFAFVVVAGRLLRIVAPADDEPPTWLYATVTACVVGTVMCAFHDSLLTYETATGLDALLLGGALVGGVVSFVTLVALRHLQPR